MKKLLLALLALTLSSPALAQAWGSYGPIPAPVWDTSGIVGIPGNNVTSEVFNTTQGSDPPSLVDEAPHVDEAGHYTRADWLETRSPTDCTPTTGPDAGIDTKCRPDHGEAKERLVCKFSHFGMADPVTAHGNPIGPHLHTFFGWRFTDENTTYALVRANPKSSCAGGPLNPSPYWTTSLIEEITPGVVVPVKPEELNIYYSNTYAISPKLIRYILGQAFIGGVDPMDRLATARIAELNASDGGGWDTERSRVNGFLGWTCVRRSDQYTVPVVNTATTDPLPASGGVVLSVRNFVGTDDADPWAGGCEGSGYILTQSINAPNCISPYALTSPNGRDHMRYPARKGDNSFEGCPRNWYVQPGFFSKVVYPAETHARRLKRRLSSDCMTNPCQPRGSTAHFDLIPSWDFEIMKTWHRTGPGVTINGVAGTPRTNDTHVIDDYTAIKTGTPPNTIYADSPIVSIPNLSSAARKLKYGKAVAGERYGQLAYRAQPLGWTDVLRPFYRERMGAKRFDCLWDFVRHGVNIQLTCSNGQCGRVGIVAAYDAVRWFKLHRWPDDLHWPDGVMRLGRPALSHFYCRRCRARASRAGATESNPTVVDFFPVDEHGWKMLQRRLRG